MEEKPNYYAIIPAEIRYDNNLKDKAKLLYGEITALSNKEGYCYASNKYFAELYGVSITTISLLIKNLVDSGYIESEIIYKDGTKEILNRYLRIIKGGYLKKVKEGYLRKVKDNNINNNNINNNNIYIYGEFKNVKLTDDEYKKLEERNLLPYIEKLSSYIASKGKRYKSHYATILNWSRKEKKDTELPEWYFNEDTKIEGSEEMENIIKELGE